MKWLDRILQADRRLLLLGAIMLLGVTFSVGFFASLTGLCMAGSTCVYKYIPGIRSLPFFDEPLGLTSTEAIDGKPVIATDANGDWDMAFVNSDAGFTTVGGWVFSGSIAAPSAYDNIVLVAGLDLPDFDIDAQKVADENECAQRCLETPGCATFTYATKNHYDRNRHQMCWLKSGFGKVDYVKDVDHYFSGFAYRAKEVRALYSASCASCHSDVSDATHSVGPHLNGLRDRSVGAAEGYAYSPALGNAQGQWDADALAAYLRNPADVYPGGKMPAIGLNDGDAHVLAHWLLTNTTSTE